MKNLMHQYKLTATTIYKAILKFKKKKKKKDRKYSVLVSEYQQTCDIHRQITKYCKARNLL